MVRSHWFVLGMGPALLTLVVAACSSSDATETSDDTKDSGTADTSTTAPTDGGNTQPADSGSTEDSGATDVPEDTTAAGGLNNTSINFGNVKCGTAAQAQTFAITNPSTKGYINFSATLGKVDDAATFDISPSSGKILPGKKQIITVTPKPIPIGADPDHATPTGANGLGDHITIVAGTAGTDGSLGVDLLQTAQGAVLAFNPTAVDFKNSPLAANTVSQQFAIQNSGNLAATVNLAVAGDNVFGITAPSVNATADGQLATNSVTFTPTAAQPYSGTVTMSVPADTTLCAALPQQPLGLAGTGINSVVGLSASSLLFGVTDCGTTAPFQTVTVTNYGGTSFKITAVAFTKNNYTYSFTAGALNSPIPGGATATIKVSPKAIPSSNGSIDDNFYGDTLTVTTDVAGDTPHAVDLRQSARGIIISRSPTGTVSFGNIGRGNVGKQPVTYLNTGNVDVTFNVAHTSANFGTPAQISIGKGSSTIANLTFTPPTDVSVNTSYTDNITFARADTTVPICQTLPTTPLAGTGVTPVTTVFPTGTQVYGSVNCGTTPGTKTLTYTNNGPAIHWTAAFQTGTQYTVSPASGDLAAGGSVDLTITPNAVPTNLTSLNTISDNLIFTPGSGEANVTSAIQVTPAGALVQWLNNTNGVIGSFGYGSVTANTTSPYNFGIKNVGSLPATFNFALAAGSNAAFSLGGATSSGGDVAINTSFSPILVNFKPTAVGGPLTATLTATSTTPICNAQVTSAQLALTGTGK